MVGSYTKAVIINSPNNPTGAVYPEEFIAEIVEFCEKRGLYLIMDDIYHRLLFDGRKPINCYELRQGPVGELQADRDQRRLQAVRHDRLPHRLGGGQPQADRGHDQHPGPPDLGPVGGAPARRGRRHQRGAVRRREPAHRPSRTTATCWSQLLRSFDGVRVIEPGRHLLLLPRLQRLQQELAWSWPTSCSRRCGWSRSPGVEFGLEGHLRISYCGSIKDITEGIERMKWALDPNAPNELYIGERKLVRDWS